MKYFIYQVEADGCGFACANMLLAKYHQDRRYLFSKYRKLKSLLDIKNYLDRNNLETIGVKIDKKDLSKNDKYSIAHIIENAHHHFVVIYHVGLKYIKILDPKRGLRILKKEDFYNIFDGILLKVKDVFKTKKKERKEINIFSYKFVYVTSLLIDFGLIYFLTFIIKKQSLTEIILLAVIILINFLVKVIAVFGANNYLDKKLIHPFIDNCDINSLELLTRYKSSFLSNTFKKMAYLLIGIFCFLILINNSIWNLILISETIIFLFMKNHLFKNHILLLKEKSYQIQANFLSNRASNYHKLNKTAKIYAIWLIIFYVILIFTFLVSSILISHLTNNFHFTYISFSLISIITIFELFNRFINTYSEEQYQLDLMKNKIKKHF